MNRDKMIEALASRLEDYRCGSDGNTAMETAAAVLDLCGPEPLVWVGMRIHDDMTEGGYHITGAQCGLGTIYIHDHRPFMGKEAGFSYSVGVFADCDADRFATEAAAQAAAQSHATAAHWASTPLGKMVGVV